MVITRREWLKQVGLLGAGLWLGEEAQFSPAMAQSMAQMTAESTAQATAQTMAQSTARKLALLVGVNQYPKSIPDLKGCVTDVELYADLLIHRFGFASADVLILTDKVATRSNIEAAFMTHLSEQARPGDIVVFQFSGYSCLVRARQTAEGGIFTQALGEQQALVPADGLIPNVVAGKPYVFNGIYEDTLFLLLRTLLTDQVTTILDTGIDPASLLRSRNLRGRALPLQEIETPSAAELALQDRLLTQADLTRDQLQAQRQAGQIPGLVLTAATVTQPTALEMDWPQFSSGLFSYGLIQQLWKQGGANITVQFNQVSNQMAQAIGEIPQPTIRGQRNFSVLPWAVGKDDFPQAVGLVTSTNRGGQVGKVLLGGLSAEVLNFYQSQSYFQILSRPGSEQDVLPSQSPAGLPLNQTVAESNSSARQTSAQRTSLVQLRSRNGWNATVEYRQGPLLNSGDFLSEVLRVLPKDIALVLALGSDLNRVERVDATSFISMENKSLQVVGDTEPADYVFTKVLAGPADSAAQINPSSDSYGLAFLSGTLVHNAAVSRESVVKLALLQLRPTLDSLLALKLLKLITNNTSPLNIIATLEQAGESPQPLIRRQSSFQSGQPIESTREPFVPKADSSGRTITIASTTLIQYRIENLNPFPVYVWLVSLNDEMTMFSSYAKESLAQSDGDTLKPLIIMPKTSVLLPTASQDWKAGNTSGLNQAFLFITREPLIETLAIQSTLLKSSLPSATAGFVTLSNPLPVVRKLLKDLSQASLPMAKSLGITPKKLWVLETDKWATLEFIYRTI